MTSAILTYAHIVSLASFGKAFASTDDMTPAITHISVTITGPKLRAVATDRYVAAILELEPLGVDAFREYGEHFADGKLEIPVSLLARMVSSNRGDKVREPHYVLDEVLDNHNGVRFTDKYTGNITGDIVPSFNFPPVDRLFPEGDTFDIPAGILIQPQYFAALGGFGFPGERPAETKVAPWGFSSTKGDTPKPSPVLAVRTSGNDSIRVLIQPNIKLR